MTNADHRDWHVTSLVNATHGITDTEPNTRFRPCILCGRHHKHFLTWSTSFGSSSLFHLSLVMTGAYSQANTQLKLGHMFFLTHYYYACTVRVAASRCHSVPCATSLRMHYNVISQGDPWLTCKHPVPPLADWEASNFLSGIPAVGMSTPFREASVDNVRRELSIFWPARVKFYQPTSNWSGQRDKVWFPLLATIKLNWRVLSSGI
jgi:hypothetical protein